MRLYRAGLIVLFFIYIGKSNALAQGCVSTNNNAVINFACGINCGNVNLQVPDLRTTSDYTLSSIPYNPYLYTSVGSNELTTLYVDDIYSAKIDIGFPFCFYDSVFTKLVVGSNGLITFDTANASCFNAWTITPTIPYSGGGLCGSSGQSTAYYPRASIMANFSDLNPNGASSAPDRKIEWRVEGTAPCRRFVASFYHVGVFGNTCGVTTPTTFQMVIYESTAIIEFFIEQKSCQSTTTGGRAIMGIQDWTQSRAIAAPGRNATVWTAQNEAYRFTPSGGATRFINSQLYTLSGTLVATATTSFTTPGVIDLSFPNICPAGASEQFIVRTSYSSCNDPLTTLITDDTITINKTTSLGATTTVTNINCATGATGSITVNVPAGNGVAPYQYSLNGGPLQSSNVFTGLADGSYTVFATDVNGCNSTLTATINRTGNLGVGFSVTNSSCSGVNNGVITILPPSFYTPIQYQLNGGPLQTSNVFTGLAAGSYTVTVTDAIGCTGSTTINVTQGAGVNATFATTPTSCSGASNGTITVTPIGGTAPYQYSLNGGPLQGSNVFSGLAAGNYNVRIIDVNGCNVSLPVTVSPGTPLNATVVKTEVSCNGGANGSITINISNGAPPYQYSLNNVTWQTSNTFTGLSAGTYTVYYRDNNACSNSQSVTITQPAVLTITASSNPVLCFGQSNGQINITAGGGTSPYQYSLNGVTYQSGNSFSVPVGVYTVYVRDVNGCVNSQTVNVSQPALLTLNATTQNASCNGGADGRITATSSGGAGAVQYSIDGTNFQTAGVFNVTPGTYTVTVRDVNNCTAIQSVTVGLTNNLTLAPAPDVTICEGTSTQLNVTTNANQFAWTPATGLSSTTISNPVANPVLTTQYILTAAFGLCSVKDTVMVNVNAAPLPNAGPDGDICFGQNYRLQGSGGVQFAWSPSATLSSNSVFNPLATPQQTTTYSLSVIDANGCSSLVQDQVLVNVTPPIVVTTNPKDTVVFDGDQFQLLASSAATNYSWTPGTGLNNPNIPNPLLTVTTDIIFTVVASTSAGCTGTNTVTIKVFKGPEIYMPTGFTPNGDGRNDKFKPIPVGVATLNYFRVYNRWGQLMFSTNVFNEGWDGQLRGTPQPTGTYVWMVQGVARSGRVITKKGTVTLIR
jgi:gliding motility-associated-like protein